MSGSGKRIHYELRPSKQVERRMFVDVFQQLKELGFPISKYQYTGLGSFYFTDFILFHKHLGINKMVSVENDTSINKRVKFNKPYKSIDVISDDIATYLPMLNKERKHLLWLDYDNRINDDILTDISTACSELPAGSILLISLNVTAPGADESEWRKYYIDNCHNYWNETNAPQPVLEANIPTHNLDFIRTAIKDSLDTRGEIFHPLFNIIYRDGATMLTLGGIIDRPKLRKQLSSIPKHRFHFLRRDLNDPPYIIRFPVMTRRERYYIDAHMPKKAAWSPAAFEMTEEKINQYRDIYRYYPDYAELVF